MPSFSSSSPHPWIQPAMSFSRRPSSNQPAGYSSRVRAASSGGHMSRAIPPGPSSRVRVASFGRQRVRAPPPTCRRRLPAASVAGRELRPAAGSYAPAAGWVGASGIAPGERRQEADGRDTGDENGSGVAPSAEFQGTEPTRIWRVYSLGNGSAPAAPHPNSRSYGSPTKHTVID
jgi:hypothetical protein